jgi:small subunit ribosomal protein S17
MAKAIEKKQKTFTAKVVELNSGRDTIKVEVERTLRHPKYEKQIKLHKTYLVHVADEAKKDLNIGEMVRLAEVAPISKRKRLILVKAKKK